MCLEGLGEGGELREPAEDAELAGPSAPNRALQVVVNPLHLLYAASLVQNSVYM